MVLVFHVAHFGIIRNADFVMRSQNQARSLPLEKLLQRFDLCRGRFLLSDVMVQAENQQSVRVCEDALIEGKFEARMIDALKQRHRMSRSLADKLLEWRECPEEQFQCACNPLLELHGVRP